MFALGVVVPHGTGFLLPPNNDRKAVEWPPHPSRLFSAMVAAYEECELGPDARYALEWLEALPESPQIYAQPPDHNGFIRDVPDVFVPVNDSSDISKSRSRQPRWFPAFTPSDRHVWFIWNNAYDHETYLPVLQRIAENVTYLGHSMSPVRVWVGGSPPEPTLVPDPSGALMLRSVGKGRLQHLENVYDLRNKNTTVQPQLGRITRYRIAKETPKEFSSSIFGQVYVFKHLQGANLPPENIGTLISTVRKSIMTLYPDPIPEVISGHDPVGNPLKSPHLAISPLLDVGHRYADGHIMGFALWLPRDVSAEVIQILEKTISELNSLTLGRFGRWEIGHLTASMTTRTAKGLRSSTYTKAHDTWASVTPVIFGRYPKKSQVGPGKNGGRVFAELCDMIGLPRPIEARIGPVSAFHGAPMASEFVFPKKFADRLRANVWLQFSEPVQGPVLVGAGRFVGFGLCRPWFG